MSKQIKVKNIKPQTIKVKNTNPHIVVTIPDPDVYDEGFEAGKEALNNEVHTELQVIIDKENELIQGTGVVPYYDKFWDSFQDYGNRIFFDYAFNSLKNLAGWFYPKYDIKPTSANYFMRDAKMFDTAGQTIDLVERLNECGVTIDFSNCTNVTYLFYQARISHLPEINVTSAGGTASTLLFGGYVETIDKFIFTKDQTLKSTFGYSGKLKDIIFEGVYEAGGLDMKYCTSLSKDSIIGVINILSTETSGKAITLSLTAVNKAFETSEGTNDGSNSNE